MFRTDYILLSVSGGQHPPVVKTMNMDFQPDLTLPTRASTIWERQRMMSSRISTACGSGQAGVERSGRDCPPVNCISQSASQSLGSPKTGQDFCQSVGQLLIQSVGQSVHLSVVSQAGGCTWHRRMHDYRCHFCRSVRRSVGQSISQGGGPDLGLAHDHHI